MTDITTEQAPPVEEETIDKADEQTPAQAENERMFGAMAKALFIVKFPVHFYSFALGQAVSFSLLTGYFSRFGIPLNAFTICAAVVLGVVFGFILEYLHHEVPRPGWRMIFEIRQTIQSPGRVIMLLVTLAAGYGLTRFSGLLTSMGGESAARYIYKEPDAPDLTARAAAYRNDTIDIARGYDGRIESVHIKYDGRVDSVQSLYQAGIDVLNRKAANDERLDKKAHPWAPGTARQYRRKAFDRASHMQSAIAKVNADRSKELAPILSGRHVDILTVLKKYRSDRDTVLARHDRLVEDLKGDNDALASLGYDVGGYAVWLLLIISFFLELYDFSRGKKYEGFAFNPARRFSRAWGNFFGIFTDKADHQIKRLEATRTHLQTRKEAKPFAWPSGRIALLGFLVVCVGFFFSKTFYSSASEYAEANIVGENWSWAGLLISVVAFGFTYKREASEREGEAPTEQDDNATDENKTKTSSLESVAKPSAKPSDDPLQSSEMKENLSAKLSADSLVSVSVSTASSVAKLTVVIDRKEYTPSAAMDKMRKWYKHSKKAKKESTRASNRKKYLAAKKATTPYFIFTERANSVKIEQR